jgi:NHS family xanthosine MFS transporter
LQITNSYGSKFIGHFANTAIYSELYTHTFAVRFNNIFLSLSQISEALFILAIPFFLRRFGIKTVMLISMIAWVLRFGLFGVGNPAEGMAWLTLSMIIYGMAFDFFNISGSLFIEKETPVKFRASAQGMLMMVTNGLGAIVGNYGAQAVINYFAPDGSANPNWPAAWFIFAAYALVIAIAFALAFRYKHRREEAVVNR